VESRRRAEPPVSDTVPGADGVPSPQVHEAECVSVAASVKLAPAESTVPTATGSLAEIGPTVGAAATVELGDNSTAPAVVQATSCLLSDRWNADMNSMPAGLLRARSFRSFRAPPS
jgi:hypothetical protein